MDRLWLGLLVVGGLVMVRVLSHTLHDLRLKRHWKQSQEALQADDLPRAEAALKKCVALMPLWTPPRVLLGVVRARQGDLPGGEAHLKLAAEFHPRQPEGYLQLGLYYATFCPEREDDAINALRKAIEYAPELRERLAHEPRLARLRHHPRFQEMLGQTTN